MTPTAGRMTRRKLRLEHIFPFFRSTMNVTLRVGRADLDATCPRQSSKRKQHSSSLSMVATRVLVASTRRSGQPLMGGLSQQVLDAREKIYIQVASERARDAWRAARVAYGNGSCLITQSIGPRVWESTI